MTPTDTVTTRRRRRVPHLLVAGLVAITGLFVMEGPPVAAAPEGASTTDWTSVSAGSNHACGIRNTGRLFCWGLDLDGQGGNGPAIGQSTPDEVVGGHTDWQQVDAGSQSTCAIRDGGLLYCWGDDSRGQVGNGGGFVDRTTPIRVNSLFADWTHVSAGGEAACARRANGRLYCWGLGRTSPTEVVGGFTTWLAPSVGENHACARRITGRLYCWGNDRRGQLGNGAGGNSAVPVEVAGALTTWTSVSAGGEHTCGRRTDGRLYCWGDDGESQLGNGGANVARQTPGVVASLFADWTSVSAGSTHTCARRATGRLYCFGNDSFGQVGDGGTNTDRSVPTEVSGALTTWASVSAGVSFACATQTTLRLFCWGHDLQERLGNGPGLANQNVPDEVSP